MQWQDSRLVWNPSNYSQIEYFEISPSRIWLPDLTLRNSANNKFLIYDQISGPHLKARVYSTGVIRWMPTLVMTAGCDLQLEKFSFDLQICTLKMSSWTHSVNEILLNFSGGENAWNIHQVDLFQKEKYDTSHLRNTDLAQVNSTKSFPYFIKKISTSNPKYAITNSNWDLITSPATSVLQNLDLHNYGSETFSLLHFHFIYQRNPSTYTFNIMIILLSFRVVYLA